jgi:hypothetical protein
VDAHGAPMKGVVVFVCTSRTRKVRTTTDGEGHYSVPAPPKHARGRIEAAAAAPGCLPRFVTPEGSEVLLGKVRYAMPDIVLTFVGLAQGRVVSLDGRPVAGAEVRILAIGVNLKELRFTEIPERLPELGRHGAGSHYRDDPFSYMSTRCVTDGEGRYALTVPRPDRVLVVVARVRAARRAASTWSRQPSNGRSPTSRSRRSRGSACGS